MFQGSRLFFKVVSVGLTLPLLSACSFITPGMHMSSLNLTPSLNQQNEVVEPKIQKIDAAYLQYQRTIEQKQLKFEKTHYHKPGGFTASSQYYAYRVAPQDTLQITVWNAEDAASQGVSSSLGQGVGASTGAQASSNAQYTIDAQGNIFYPYLGKIRVSGKTIDQIRHIIASRMNRYIQNPQVTINVVGYNSQKVAVTGAVEKPVMLPINNVPLNVLSAVTAAGGPIRCGVVTQGNVTQTCADLHGVQVRRGNQVATVDLNQLVAINGSSNNWVLKGGDIVYVPNNNASRIFVLGAVNAPGPFNMVDGSMTLREALGDARGVSGGANPSYTYVIRNFHHNPAIFLLDIGSADALNLAGEFDLAPGDIVFVSSSLLANFNQIVKQVTPTLLAAASIHSLTR